MDLHVAILRYHLRYRALSLVRRASEALGSFLVTLVGLLMAVAFALFLPTDVLRGSALSVSGVHLACAGIIGTALTLVLTISIVPAQRAADVFSSAILVLYARDRQLLFVFASLALLTLLSVLSGTNWTFGVSARYTLAAQLVFLSATFDLLRAFYRRALTMLIPATALTIVEERCRRLITAMKREAERRLVIDRLTGEESGQPGDEVRRWRFYSRSQAPYQLIRWIAELEEFAHKAIARRDTHAADTIIKTMAVIGVRYADSRKDSLILVPDLTMLSSTSDVENVLRPIYESLKNLTHDAARQFNESVVIACVQALGLMATHAMTMISTQHDRWRTVPLAYAPVFYLGLCTERAIAAEMDDALLASIRAVGQLFTKISDDVHSNEAEAGALALLFKVAQTSYSRQTTVPCFEAVKTMLLAARQDLRLRRFRSTSIINAVLRNVAMLVPLEAVMDKAGQRTLQTFPPYDTTFEANIPVLLAELADRGKPLDPNHSWVDPFRDFSKASEKIVLHYRDIAKKVPFDGVLLQKWIVDSIISAAEVHVGLLKDPPHGSESFLETVEISVRWFIHAPTFFFRETTSFPSDHAHDAAGSLTILGMNLLLLERRESAMACGNAISALGRKSGKASNGSPYTTADILVKLEVLARAAVALGHQLLAQEFRELARPEGVPAQDLSVYQQALLTSIEHLDEDLMEADRLLPLPHDPLPMLRAILRANRSHSSDP